MNVKQVVLGAVLLIGLCVMAVAAYKYVESSYRYEMRELTDDDIDEFIELKKAEQAGKE